MSNQAQSNFQLNWDKARIIPAEPKVSIFGGSETLDAEKQKYYQERYGDDLTKAIKVARHNLRKEKHNGLLEG